MAGAWLVPWRHISLLDVRRPADGGDAKGHFECEQTTLFQNVEDFAQLMHALKAQSGLRKTRHSFGYHA